MTFTNRCAFSLFASLQLVDQAVFGAIFLPGARESASAVWRQGPRAAAANGIGERATDSSQLRPLLSSSSPREYQSSTHQHGVPAATATPPADARSTSGFPLPRPTADAAAIACPVCYADSGPWVHDVYACEHFFCPACLRMDRDAKVSSMRRCPVCRTLPRGLERITAAGTASERYLLQFAMQNVGDDGLRLSLGLEDDDAAPGSWTAQERQRRFRAKLCDCLYVGLLLVPVNALPDAVLRVVHDVLSGLRDQFVPPLSYGGLDHESEEERAAAGGYARRQLSGPVRALADLELAQRGEQTALFTAENFRDPAENEGGTRQRRRNSKVHVLASPRGLVFFSERQVLGAYRAPAPAGEDTLAGYGELQNELERGADQEAETPFEIARTADGGIRAAVQGFVTDENGLLQLWQALRPSSSPPAGLPDGPFGLPLVYDLAVADEAGGADWREYARANEIAFFEALLERTRRSRTEEERIEAQFGVWNRRLLAAQIVSTVALMYSTITCPVEARESAHSGDEMTAEEAAQMARCDHLIRPLCISAFVFASMSTACFPILKWRLRDCGLAVAGLFGATVGAAGPAAETERSTTPSSSAVTTARSSLAGLLARMTGTASEEAGEPGSRRSPLVWTDAEGIERQFTLV